MIGKTFREEFGNSHKMQMILRGLIRIRRRVAGIFSGRTPYVDTVQGGIFGQGQRLVWGRSVEGSGGQSPPDAGKIFIKNPMKNYNFRAIFQNFNENFAIFTKFFKKFLAFSPKIWGKPRIMQL